MIFSVYASKQINQTSDSASLSTKSSRFNIKESGAYSNHHKYSEPVDRRKNCHRSPITYETMKEVTQVTTLWLVFYARVPEPSNGMSDLLNCL